MPLARWLEQATPLPGWPGARRLEVTAADWRAAATDAAAAAARLIALWASPAGAGASVARVQAAFLAGLDLLVLELLVPDPALPYPGLQIQFPAASRMQRAARDLAGVRADEADQRPWLRHGAWPPDRHPLVPGPLPAAAALPLVPEPYDFVRVAGEGVHEIPVGPVHAGTIEPGHFRFSVVGEKVLKLEQRLGYTHKGIERRFTELPLGEAHRLAARISGDSTVAFSWAFCQALEGLTGTAAPPRAQWLRALCLEIERVQNHLGDLGALGNDAGFAFGLAQFSRLKEELLRALEAVAGQRYLMDAIVPGGVAFDPPPEARAALERTLAGIAQESAALRGIYDEHAGVRDRFTGAGQVAPALARRLGLTGLAGRASGQAFDLRVDAPQPPYDVLAPAKCVLEAGDVAARVAIRFEELAESIRLARRILSELPPGPRAAPLSASRAAGLAIGLVEGWRGPVMLALDVDAEGNILRCHPHDPSWQNWPAIEHAATDDIVPDFPLVNKSFNLAYSGHDL